ncbi:hypothetical protein CPB86DRAFT_370615 [Serendipita vermifera]|nr:hypothetical protein CPB86DRAFT_370615 [Serendipita vermifera]
MTMIHTPAGKAAIIRLLRVNTDQGSKTWSCTFGGIGGMCPDGVFKRRDAATSHILQEHLYVYPIKCDGECGDRQCKQRFPGSAAKSSHTRKAQKRVCDLCHQLVSSRNYSRHRKAGKCHINAALV